MSRVPKRERTKEEQYSMFPDKGTTKPGYVNPRDQEVIRNTRKTGTGRGHWIYELKSRHSGNCYGANGSYNHRCQCPQCQGGEPGPSPWRLTYPTLSGAFAPRGIQIREERRQDAYRRQERTHVIHKADVRHIGQFSEQRSSDSAQPKRQPEEGS